MAGVIEGGEFVPMKAVGAAGGDMQRDKNHREQEENAGVGAESGVNRSHRPMLRNFLM